MTTQAEAFKLQYLGATATTPPTDAVRKAMAAVLPVKPFKNPLEAGSMASERNDPGLWPPAYAIHHGIVTAEQMEPRFREWVEFERGMRGLGKGPLATPMTHVYKSTHATVTRHALIGALSVSAETRKLAQGQMLQLADLMMKDDVVTEPIWLGPSRGIGWTAQAFALTHKATGIATYMHGFHAALNKLSPDGEDAGGPYIWKNLAQTKDPNHVYDRSTWMDSTCVKAAAQVGAKTLLLHGLRCLQFAQKPDGSFWSDWGTDKDGQPGFHQNPKDATNPWIWPALHAAVDALDDDCPPWVTTMVSRAKERWAAMNRMKPTDSGFKDSATMGIAIECCPRWGWRTK